jgi:hypothetical protein
MTNRIEALARLRRIEDEIPEGRSFVVQPAGPEDAEGTAKLFHIIYGENYPVDVYYDPDGLRREQAAENVRSMVARLDTGHIVGHLALYRASAPFAGLLECGLGMVHPLYRGTFILFHLFEAFMNGPAKAPNVPAVFGEAIADKLHTQHLAALYGMRESAIELEVMPGTGQGRVSCLFQHLENDKPRHRLHVPTKYASQLDFILNGTNLQRNLTPADGTLTGTTKARVDHFASAQVLRASVIRPGRDFTTWAEAAEARAKDMGCRVLQWFVNLGRADVEQVVDVLHSRGAFLGGLVPRWFDTDALLMQKLEDEPDWDRIQLFSAKARTLLGLLRQDFAGSKQHG